MVALFLILLSSGLPPVAADTTPAGLAVAAAIIVAHDASALPPEKLPPGAKILPLLVNTESIVDALAAAGYEATREEVNSAIRAPYQDVTEEQAFRCVPWRLDPRQESCRVLNDGLYIEFERIARTPAGWEVVVEFSFTGSERNPGQWQTQGRKTRYVYVREGEKWTKVEEEALWRWG